MFCSVSFFAYELTLEVVLDKYHWMLYYLVPSMYPRFMITLDEDLKNLPVTVRVGQVCYNFTSACLSDFKKNQFEQAVEVVGQAGKPRTISGFQTHTSPVRLGTTERAELATEEWIPYAHVLEGCVILKKNPGYEDKMDI